MIHKRRHLSPFRLGLREVANGELSFRTLLGEVRFSPCDVKCVFSASAVHMASMTLQNKPVFAFYHTLRLTDGTVVRLLGGDLIATDKMVQHHLIEPRVLSTIESIYQGGTVSFQMPVGARSTHGGKLRRFSLTLDSGGAEVRWEGGKSERLAYHDIESFGVYRQEMLHFSWSLQTKRGSPYEGRDFVIRDFPQVEDFCVFDAVLREVVDRRQSSFDI